MSYQLLQELGKTVRIGHYIVKASTYCCSASLKNYSGVFGRVKIILHNVVVKGASENQ